MFSLRSLFGGSDTVLGVDIGTTSIKVAEVKLGKERNKLLNYGILETYSYLERFNEAIQTSSLKLSERNTANYLNSLIRRAGIKTKEAIAALPAFLTFSTLIEVPAMSEEEIKQFIEMQANQYVPLPLSMVTIDWMKVGERTDPQGVPKFQILLVSIPNDQLNAYQNIFKAAGLKLLTIEVEGMSLARSLVRELEGAHLIIDIGSRSTSFSIVEKGFLKFSGQTDFSGGSLTQVIANGLDISERRAEDLKRQRGLLGYGGEHELSTLMQPLLDVIISEARRVIGNYEAGYGEKIQGAILTGGGANLLGIDEYFKKQLALPLTKANPFLALEYPPLLDAITRETGPLLAVAIGLGMKRF